jgi:hypothetical protein
MEGLAVVGSLLIRLPVLGAYAVGVLLSAVLVARRRDTPSWLVLVGFGLLLVVNVASWFLGALPMWSAPFRGMTIGGTLACLSVILSLVSAVGALCLAFGLWMGMRPPAR